MDTITMVLILLLAVIISGVAGRMLPIAIPLPLVQILIGALIEATMDAGAELKPEIFFLLLLPPLLFLDGWRLPPPRFQALPISGRS
jgi:monovalent cation/hydrogen antiporter